jgi:urea carboxylase
MFRKVLVANRGEIACRVLRTLRRMEVPSVAVYSEVDANALHVRMADEAFLIGPPAPAESYLNVGRILEVARTAGAEAIHPGYGFLSENAGFAEACAAAGVRFIGPAPDQIRRFGLKHLAREVARAQRVPLLPGTGLLTDLDEARQEATRIGYPVICKSSAGGGGIGLRVCRDEASLAEAFESVRRLARQNFEEGGVYLERFLEPARHVEVQIFGDGKGQLLALGERDCSAQRRNQKVVEESPAPGLRPEVRRALQGAAVRMGQAVGYSSAGTVEFVVDGRTQEYYFLEVNTRLQVEHGVTEEVTGIDLVEWMVRQAAGELTLSDQAPPTRGAAIEARIYAEDPGKGFQPSTGMLTAVALPPAVRTDGWIEPGLEITPHYDPLLVKVIARGDDRAQALERLSAALADAQVHGIETNLGFVRALLAHPSFARGEVRTDLLAEVEHAPAAIDVLEGGTQTTVQDWPGRLGLWAVGVPPSGPMDDFAFRLANRLVGNPPGAPALELVLAGPTLRFRQEQVVALAGADLNATLDGQPVPANCAFTVPAGGLLRLGTVAGAGARAYLAVRGGLDVPAVFGSRATFLLGGFGGHGGRALRPGDVLRVGGCDPVQPPIARPASVLPEYRPTWEIAVLYGPHGAPDFFTESDIQIFFDTPYRVHHNSDRTGVRLLGPRPTWARDDGGEAGLHPSNIHDNAYAVGTVDFTGDMPILLGPDGPSLGGFVCPATIVQAERWKMGQLKAGDWVHFRRVTPEEAAALLEQQTAALERLAPPPKGARAAPPVEHAPILAVLAGGSAVGPIPVTYRRAGDDYLLVEYGPNTLDLGLRLRAHTLMEALEALRLPGVIDLTAGIRSLQVHHNPRVLDTTTLLETLRSVEASLPAIESLRVASREVYLPLSWEDPATLAAIEKYQRVVRPDAPWCPSNIEFIRRINGLAGVDEVRRIIYEASWLVLGLGDVYLGAPVATPIDPRHRLVTTKYNPARTWTPENAVGIGGAYLCVYGMEGPGGYQLFGRTVQVWSTHRQPPPFSDGKPWLLRPFDRIRFYPVDAAELLKMRAGFPHGRTPLRIEPGTFDYADYRRLVREQAAEIVAFKTRQQAAFLAERERWAAAGQDLVAADPLEAEPPASPPALPPGCHAVVSPVAGNLWKMLKTPGQRVHEGEVLAVVEAMKTEISVTATVSGTVREILVAPGRAVMPGQPLAVVREEG